MKMGQRHQIYVAFKDYGARLLKASNDNRPLTKADKSPVKIIGVHHQWLFGQTAAKQAMRMMQLVDNRSIKNYADQDYSNPFWNAERAMRTLKAIYTMIPEDGYFTNVHELDVECKNPLLGDNNDGITIFDFTDFSAPKYCFMGINDRPFESESTAGVSFMPYSAKMYESFYYPDTDTAKWKARMTTKAQIREIMVEKRKIAALSYKFIKNVLTSDRVKAIFPAMFANKATFANCQSV